MKRSTTDVVVALVVVICTMMGVEAYNSVLQNAKMEFTVNVNTTGEFYGYIYPKNNVGDVVPEYWALWQIVGFYENGTNRDILPTSLSRVDAFNPKPNSLIAQWNFTSSYNPNAMGVFNFTVLAKNENSTFANWTIVGQEGLKIGAHIANDTNLFNTTTVKYFFFNLTFSHPVLSFNKTNYPTPFQHNYVFTTQYYKVIFNTVGFSLADGVYTYTGYTIEGFTFSGSYITSFLLKGLLYWNMYWDWDPEVAIILNPGVGDVSGDGDGTDTNLAYISLVALTIAPIGVLIVIVVAVVIFALRRRRLHRRVARIGATLVNEDTVVPT